MKSTTLEPQTKLLPKGIIVVLPILLSVLVSACWMPPYTQVEYIGDGKKQVTVTRISTSARNCVSNETILVKDSITDALLSREEIEYDCRGAYSYPVSRKKWEVQDGKEVRIK